MTYYDILHEVQTCFNKASLPAFHFMDIRNSIKSQIIHRVMKDIECFGETHLYQDHIEQLICAVLADKLRRLPKAHRQTFLTIFKMRAPRIHEVFETENEILENQPTEQKQPEKASKIKPDESSIVNLSVAKLQ